MNVTQATNVTARSTRKMAGEGGFIKYAGLGAHTGLQLTSIINGATAATISVWEEDDVDMLAARGFAIDVAPGEFLPAPAGRLITKVTSTQDFIGYLKDQ